MNACGCTNLVRSAGHAESRSNPQPEERIVSLFSVLEININW
jgi:hypothetical protein